MNKPEILKHSGSHQVSITAGSKNAQSKQSAERSALNPGPQIGLQNTHLNDHPEPISPEAQLPAADADSADVWDSEDDMSRRMDQLNQKNLELGQKLHRLTRSGRKEEKNE